MTRSDPFGQSHSQGIPEQSQHKNLEQATFEEVYPRYEFSELVRLFLALVTWLQRRRDRRSVDATRDKWPTAGPDATA